MRPFALVAFAAAVLAAAALSAAQISAAPSASGQEHGKGHKQHHVNAHDLLGENLHHNGKHDVGKLGTHAVTADVNNNKVVGMDAGGLPVKKVKTKQKMALNGMGLIQVAANGELQLADYAYTDYYYGYCFDDGYETTCYWYTATDVEISGVWDDYTGDPLYY